MTAVDRSPKPFTGAFIAAIMLGAALNPVNSSIIPTALAPIAHDFEISPGRATVLVSVLYLACAVAQPTAGKLAEQLGPRKVFLTGAVLVLVGGLLGGVSPTFTGLVVARVLIGLGTSAGYPSAMVMIRQRADQAGMPTPPGGVLAALAIVGLALIAIGPPIGGILVGSLGWRSTFFLNVPVSVAAMILTLIAVPSDGPIRRSAEHGILTRIDLTGIIGFALTMSALLVFLLSIPSPTWLALVIAVAVGAAFVIWELRAPSPFFDVRELVSNLPLTLTYLRTAMTMLGAYVILYALPQWLQDGHGYGAEPAGLIIIPMGIVAAAASTLISRRSWMRWPMVAAGAAMVIGGLLMGGLTAAGLPVIALVVTALFGVTLGGSIASGQLALYAQAAPDRVGSAAGLLRTFTYLGSIGASVISGVVFRDQVTDAGLHGLGWIVAALGAITVVITVLDRSLRRRPSVA